MKKIILIISMFIIFLDQLLKLLVINNMNLYDSISIIPHFLNITFMKNDGGAFSILSGSKWLFVVVALIVLGVLIKYIINDKKCNLYECTIYSVIIGGVIGNLIDRIIYGSVVDFISINIFGYYAPIFNFADMCIVIGAFMLCLRIIRGEKYENNKCRK